MDGESEHPFSVSLLTPRTVFRTRRTAASHMRQFTMECGVTRTRLPPAGTRWEVHNLHTVTTRAPQVP